MSHILSQVGKNRDLDSQVHIAMVTPFPKDPHCIGGGVAGVAKYLVDELVKHPNVKLTVVVPKDSDGKTIREEWRNVNIYRLGKKGLLGCLPGTVYDILAGRRQINRLLKQINPDIVHFQGVTFLAANCRYPNVLTIHGIAERDAMWDRQWGALRWLKCVLLKLTEEYGRRRVKNVILISEYIRQFLPPKNKITKTWSIENPIADSYFDIDRQFEPGRIFCCSRVRPLKNIVGLIRAFSDVVQRFPQAQLKIAGSPEAAYLQLCEREIEANKLRTNVHLLGNLSIKDVQYELSKANCFAIPSFQENAPLSIAEAMAVGVPVVGARVGGIPEMVEDGKTGFLVNPHDTKDIADALCKILSDGTLARSMGYHAKEIAKRRYMASAVCEKTLHAYHEILKETL
jgi:glycosyltransferase involved in cell wall biosynthesis